MRSIAAITPVNVTAAIDRARQFNDFMFAANALTGKDEYSVKYLKYTRANIAAAKAAAAKPARQTETTEVSS